MSLVDSHAHLLPEYLDPEQTQATLVRARAAGVIAIVVPGTTLLDSRAAVALAGHEPDVWAAAGCHPHEARGLDAAALAELAQLARHPRVVAIGECGLDYHYDHSPRPVQQEVLRAQIRLARELGKPLVLHNRESDEDLLHILEQERAGEVGGVVHAFSTTPEVARRCLALGFHLGFGGMITFKTADLVRASLRATPLDRLLLETDAPYLAPVPHRGRPNEPALIALVAARAALELEVGVEELARQTSENATRLFGLAARSEGV